MMCIRLHCSRSSGAHPLRFIRCASRMGCSLVCFCVAFLCFGVIAASAEDAPKVRIYLDADRTGALTSGDCIEQGIQTALSEVGNKLGGREVEIVVKDHHGNSRRSRKHLTDYLKDDSALAVYCGLHSPPVLANRDFINENGILLLDPWAAAGPITRSASDENWIFRLSIDDTKAGHVIVDYAVEKRGFRKPVLLLEETGWGRSNDQTMRQALARHGLKPVETVWFNWGINDTGARIHLRNIIKAGADVVLLVANAHEGKTFVRAMAALPEEDRLPICSHWGITGGDFVRVVGEEVRSKVSLVFIQTKFSFMSDPENPFGLHVFEQAKKVFPDAIHIRRDILAPAGFIHAYDLTKLLIAAVEKAGLSSDIKADRRRVRDALENLDEPIQGLVKTYQNPFSRYDKSNPDAHEALDVHDYVMARFGPQGEILIEKE